MPNTLTISSGANRIEVSSAYLSVSSHSTLHRIMSTEKKSLFVMDDGKNLMFTFILVSSLFLLWGICNGMIDVMDKHFQRN